jgi:hypothetical protein
MHAVGRTEDDTRNSAALCRAAVALRIDHCRSLELGRDYILYLGPQSTMYGLVFWLVSRADSAPEVDFKVIAISIN